MEITFTYPSWLVLICIFAGVLYSALFYRKDKALNETPQWLIYVMALARFMIISLIGVLLLKPLVESEDQKVEKPIVVIAQDNSESVLFNKDSTFYRNEFPEKLLSLKEALSIDYQVEVLSYGDQVSDSLFFDFTDKQTDLSMLMDEIEAKYFGRNLGAVILSGDGLYNKGLNPLYANQFVESTTFYTVALGDTNKKKDLAIANVAHNKLAYLGNDFPIEVVVNADYLKGQELEVSILKNGKELAVQQKQITADNEVITLPFKIEADKAGKQLYTVKVKGLGDEFTLLNNEQEVFIEVLDNKQEILIVTAAPHPDVAAIKYAIEKNINYKVTVENILDYAGGMEQFNLVILHQVPSLNGGEQKLMKDIKKEKIPVLYFVGGQSNYAAFNQLKTGLSLIGPNGSTDAKPTFNPGFSNFTLEDNIKDILPNLPPVQIPFANDYQVTNAVNVMLYQKIGNTTTNFPLIGFNAGTDQKVGFVLGEGIWRWKFQDYIKNNNNLGFESLISKIIQYLAVKEDKSKFRVYAESEYLENEKVILNAELYNDIYELVNEAEVNLVITDEKGEEFPTKTFAKAGQSYRLDAGVFMPGKYAYKAKTSYNGENYEVEGEFVVKALKVEYLNTVADHQLLYSLAEKTGGKMYSKDDFEQILNDIEKNNKIASISYVNQTLTDVIKWGWILILLIALLSLEWFLRKRYGAY
ncbi:hypothetical protein [Parvicella tangerina]|uniref:VWA domain-containing protein n=1 Tax=Parvicella tangerina TaxID=2829795 RepID=A0A916NGU6_9FLAO|nr:hypothetical protein [Parvicella tangerina]CAG5080398.1 hypothetical protein CRYO30217_01292 [Parvicella tangerina]